MTTLTLATRAAEGLDRRAFTVSDVERMIEAGVLDPDEKFELIGGEIVPMSPQGRPHFILKTRLARVLAPLVPPGLELYSEPTIFLRPRALLEPDLAIAAVQPFTAGYLPMEDVRLAIEVADTSLTRDLRKAKDYAEAALAELWILDLEARQTLVFRTLEGVWTERPPIPFDEPIAALCLPGETLLVAPLTE